MKRKRPRTGDLAELTDELTPDDGQDPKQFFDRRRWSEQPRTPGRKARQLCEQVKVSLHGILAVCADDVVRDLQVLSVLPAPHAGRLQIAVAVPSTADAIDRRAAEVRLQVVAGWIRSEVASAVHRRKVPELVWVVS